MLKRLLFLIFLISATKSDGISPRVIGGFTALEDQFPFIVSLRDSSSWEHFCAGNIIDQFWIITPVHCVMVDGYFRPPFSIEIFTGTTSLKHDEGGRYVAKQVITHPNFDSETLKNDIALIQLWKPLDFESGVIPIDIGKIRDGKKVLAAGWGQMSPKSPKLAKHLQFVILSTMKTEQCQKIHARANNIVDGTTQICAYGRRNETLCLGDSGGPLINLHGKLVGIFSGMENCSGEYPVLFVRLAAYLDWINSVTGLHLTLE